MSTKTKKSSTQNLLSDESLASHNILRTWLNTFPPEDAITYEPPTGPSETIPDQVIDLRLMIDRATSGIPQPQRQDGYSEEDYPDIWKMDEFELAEYRESIAHQMVSMRDELHVASKKLEELERLANEEQSKKVVTKQPDNSSEE